MDTFGDRRCGVLAKLRGPTQPSWALPWRRGGLGHLATFTDAQIGTSDWGLCLGIFSFFTIRTQRRLFVVAAEPLAPLAKTVFFILPPPLQEMTNKRGDATRGL